MSRDILVYVCWEPAPQPSQPIPDVHDIHTEAYRASSVRNNQLDFIICS